MRIITVTKVRLQLFPMSKKQQKFTNTPYNYDKLWRQRDTSQESDIKNSDGSIDLVNCIASRVPPTLHDPLIT